MTVRPSLARAFNVDTRELAVVESSPLVGSSRIIILGLVKSSEPIFKRFFSPPLIKEIGVFSHFCSFNWDTTSVT